MGTSWRDWPPSRPIRVAGGIKARSKRGAIGEQWWSRRFIGVLESYGMSGRLARGRSYARAGQVLDFELAQGRVTARVQGSRVRPYQVRIGVLPLTTAQWQRVQEYFTNNLHRMEYPEYEAEGWQIGSGVVESACKTVVGQRLKGAGMRWGEQGAHGVCHVSALYRSEKGQWQAYWRGRTAKCSPVQQQK